ncbi:hypothetical protein LSH36_67g04021 [Paralvinella palmiformis]|uniref:Peptidase M14 domain-containing protein n=1 Tax=Paralvinella palmiformis TaxID=53620 RepID=A0AAD9NEH8_9ANNE|nr:hypothetical protein LSH36_67g04021 [Paralvinella palmiformis]
MPQTVTYHLVFIVVTLSVWLSASSKDSYADKVYEDDDLEGYLNYLWRPKESQTVLPEDLLSSETHTDLEIKLLIEDLLLNTKNKHVNKGNMSDELQRCRGRCSLFNIGSSYEGRPLIGIKIALGTTVEGYKPKIWISAGVHAREWISHTSALYIVNMLIQKFDEDPYVHHLVESYEWYILPCVNPDGYNYTWTTDRLWRKTRSYNPGTTCVGTDANRNFDFKWGVNFDDNARTRQLWKLSENNGSNMKQTQTGFCQTRMLKNIIIHRLLADLPDKHTERIIG